MALLPHAPPRSPQLTTPAQYLLVGVGLSYMLCIVILPFFNVFVQAFQHGMGPFLETLAEPDFQQAIKMTLLLSLVSVPINTAFGVSAAILLARNDFPGRTLVISVLDLPFSISPVVTGVWGWVGGGAQVVSGRAGVNVAGSGAGGCACPKCCGHAPPPLCTVQA